MNTIDELRVLWDNSRNDDEHAFALLHQDLYPSLFAYVVKIIKDEDLADDLLQELFIKLWQTKTAIGTIVNVKAYFFRSIRCMALNDIKSRQRREVKLDAMPVPELEFSKEELMMSAEFDAGLKHLLLLKLNALPAKQREIIHMRFYQDLDCTQISDIMGIRYQSVVNHVYRAVSSLRETCAFSELYVAS
ncbi:RNA polymerase sigma factor [Pedobacter sp. AW31-3R]|uniref:RNA polymerase sigma factor n=1 Tax=Pedobacter sp. AW31-3R TaxID=3445781 RepID=UPI003FA0D74F